MDKNTLVGLGLIALILGIFTYMNQPDPEAFKEQQEQAQKELEERNTLEKERKKQAFEAKNDTVQAASSDSPAQKSEVVGDSAELINTDGATSKDIEEQVLWLKNDKIALALSTTGGGVTQVNLLNHQTYDDFIKNEETGEVTPLTFLKEEQATNQLVFTKDGKAISTADLNFEINHESKERVELIHHFGQGQSVEFVYSLLPESYHLSYEIKMNGFEGEVLPENVMLEWNTRLKKTERLMSEQRRTSTVFFKGIGDSYDYLSEFSDDEYAPTVDVEWVAFKQSYFSGIMMPENGFKKEGANFKISSIPENTPEDSIYIKDYFASLNLNIGNTGSGYAKMNWYFGPNDYYMLQQYGNGAEDIVNLGWGIFRWVNIYAIQPIFTWLASSGINLGLAIFLLTLIVKIALTPIQWKMYASSAKMRILKPEIEEINKKYPEKDDAMKKQMEMMTLYRESGASPLAGCIPMLIQMPVLFAVFRFFPSTFELRQKSFLWAEDLSSFDSIMDLGFDIPFYGDHVSLFTLLMAGTTLIYTVLNSSNMQQPSQPGMPNMKVIMYIFPIMMIFFFNNFASGLSYYYFLSTLISILTMLMIKNFFIDEEKLKAKMAAKKAGNKKEGGKGKKSKFQEKLEQMQKIQQEKGKKRK